MLHRIQKDLLKHGTNNDGKKISCLMGLMMALRDVESFDSVYLICPHSGIYACSPFLKKCGPLFHKINMHKINSAWMVRYVEEMTSTNYEPCIPEIESSQLFLDGRHWFDFSFRQIQNDHKKFHNHYHRLDDSSRYPVENPAVTYAIRSFSRKGIQGFYL